MCPDFVGPVCHLEKDLHSDRIAFQGILELSSVSSECDTLAEQGGKKVWFYIGPHAISQQLQEVSVLSPTLQTERVNYLAQIKSQGFKEKSVDISCSFNYTGVSGLHSYSYTSLSLRKSHWIFFFYLNIE